MTFALKLQEILAEDDILNINSNSTIILSPAEFVNKLKCKSPLKYMDKTFTTNPQNQDFLQLFYTIPLSKVRAYAECYKDESWSNLINSLYNENCALLPFWKDPDLKDIIPELKKISINVSEIRYIDTLTTALNYAIMKAVSKYIPLEESFGYLRGDGTDVYFLKKELPSFYTKYPDDYIQYDIALLRQKHPSMGNSEIESKYFRENPKYREKLEAFDNFINSNTYNAKFKNYFTKEMFGVFSSAIHKNIFRYHPANLRELIRLNLIASFSLELSKSDPILDLLYDAIVKKDLSPLYTGTNFMNLQNNYETFTLFTERYPLLNKWAVHEKFNSKQIILRHLSTLIELADNYNKQAFNKIFFFYSGPINQHKNFGLMKGVQALLHAKNGLILDSLTAFFI